MCMYYDYVSDVRNEQMYTTLTVWMYYTILKY